MAVSAAMPTVLTFVVPGVVGKERPRAVTRKSRAIFYTPSKTTKWERDVALAARQKINEAFGGRAPSADSYYVSLVAAMRPPKRLSNAQRRALRGRPCVRKPDLDNVIKAVLDGLTGVIWDDDSQVVGIKALRVWAADEECGTAITVQWLDDVGEAVAT